MKAEKRAYEDIKSGRNADRTVKQRSRQGRQREERGERSLRCISALVTVMPCDAKPPGPKPVVAKWSWPGDSGGKS
jgi:hypothetical protein